MKMVTRRLMMLRMVMLLKLLPRSRKRKPLEQLKRKRRTLEQQPRKKRKMRRKMQLPRRTPSKKLPLKKRHQKTPKP